VVSVSDASASFTGNLMYASAVGTSTLMRLDSGGALAFQVPWTLRLH
jgi:hypothetical protein